MLKMAKTSILAVAVMATSIVASDILVTVNGENITKQDAEQFVKLSAPKASYAQLEKEQQDMIKTRLIQKVLFKELAEKEGIENKPEFKEAMKSIKKELLVNVWMKVQLDNTIVSDGEAKEFYDKNQDKFMQAATLTAKHILVKTKEDAEAIIADMKDLKDDDLKAKFVELAKSKSTGPSAPKGGDLGTFTSKQMVPEFSKAAEELDDGTITTAPVKTQFGFHIIYLEKKNPSTTVSYDLVKDQIVLRLKQQQFAKKIEEIAKELESKATIVDASAPEKSVEVESKKVDENSTEIKKD